MRIADVLRNKGSAVATIGPDTTVADLLAGLSEFNIGALIVSADGKSLDGIVSERDVVRRLNEDDKVVDAPVSAIMTSDVRTATTDQNVVELLQLMTEHRFRHVPVVEGGAVTGIVSIGDIVKSRMSELEFERDQLDSYVHGAQT